MSELHLRRRRLQFLLRANATNAQNAVAIVPRFNGLNISAHPARHPRRRPLTFRLLMQAGVARDAALHVVAEKQLKEAAALIKAISFRRRKSCRSKIESQADSKLPLLPVN